MSHRACCGQFTNEAQYDDDSGIPSSSRQAEQSLLELIVAHRHRLAEGFAAQSIASGTKGRVTCQQWADVMATELQLPLDWHALQPSLVPTVQRAAVAADGSVTMKDTGLIDTNRFLDGYAKELTQARSKGGGGSGGDGDERAMAEMLCSKHPQLITIFRYLDTDGNGKVDRAEWERGVTLLNERLPPEQRLDDAILLFEEMDLDGSGELELDEFAAAFRRAV